MLFLGMESLKIFGSNEGLLFMRNLSFFLSDHSLKLIFVFLFFRF